jgi:hypothetical protein
MTVFVSALLPSKFLSVINIFIRLVSHRVHKLSESWRVCAHGTQTTVARNYEMKQGNISLTDWKPWPPEGERLSGRRCRSASCWGHSFTFCVALPSVKALLRSLSKEFRIKRMGQRSARRDRLASLPGMHKEPRVVTPTSSYHLSASGLPFRNN